MKQKDQLSGKLSMGEKLSYSMGEVATCAMFALFTTLLIFFYTDVVGVSPATIGTIVAISQVFNGASDVCAGFLVDRTRSKHGRVRVWLLRMAIPYTVASVLLMTVPQIGGLAQAIYIFITYNLMLTVVYTMTQLPYATLVTYLTRDQYERASANIIRMTISPLANMAMTLGFLPLVSLLGGGQQAWIKATAIYGIVCSALLLWCFFFTKERVQVVDETKGEKIPLKTAITVLFKNKYFIIAFLFFFALAFYQTVAGTMLTYYCKNFLGTENLMGVINSACQIMMVVSTPVIGLLIHKMSKRNWCVFGAVCIMVGALIVPFGPTGVPVVFAGSLLRGIGLACEYAMMYTMVADVVEYGQWKTGIRTPSAIQSAVTSGQKFGQGICSAAIGAIMSWAGYNGVLSAAEQSQKALDTVYNLFVYGMVGTAVFVIVILMFYHLDKEYPTIMQELLEREKKAAAGVDKEPTYCGEDEPFIEQQPVYGE